MSTISHRFFDAARTAPGKTVLWCDGSAISYGDLAVCVARWSAMMRQKGVIRGDHIAVLLPNSVEFVTLMLAAADIGAVLVPLNISLPSSAVEKAFRASDVRHVVAAGHVIDTLLSESSADIASADGLWVAVGAMENDKAGRAASLASLLAEIPADAQPAFAAQADDPYILTMTSGSTGDPKPIILTQRTKLNRAAAAVEMYGVSAADRTLAATPLYHSLAERLVLIPLLTGGTSVLMSRFSAAEWMRVVAEQAVSFTIAVSSQLNQIAALIQDGNAAQLASLRCIVSSSALLDTVVKQSLVAKLRCEFHECYGASEIAIASNLDAAAARGKLKSVGIAAAGVEIQILGPDDQPVAAGEPGEIVCRTPMLFGGYYKRLEQTQAAMWGEFFRTGDLGRLDEEGFLYFLGRKKEIIITGGINVYPADIEAAVADTGTAQEVAAFSLPDERLGEIVAVALVPKNPDEFNLKAVRFHCANHLADYQQPRKWFILDALPKNPMGKVMKSMLQSQCGSIEK
jgi:long-chain acyl-CoA synthetase